MTDNWNLAERIASWQARHNNEPDVDTDVRHHHSDDHHHGGGSRSCVGLNACGRNVCRSFEVAVPVTIRPIGAPLAPSASCGGVTNITPGRGRSCSPRSFDFTITQLVNVDLPIEFGVEVCYHRPYAEDNGPCSVAESTMCNCHQN